MPRAYTQLITEERQKTAHYRAQGLSYRAVSRLLHRAHTTVLREVRRNHVPGDRYRAEFAVARTAQRRHQRRGSYKLSAELLPTVQAWLARGWSPEIIAGRLGHLGLAYLSRAPLYQLLRDHPAWPHRAAAPRRPTAPYQRIRHGRTWRERSPAAQHRTEALHFEGDTLGSPQAHSIRLGVATCRTTRYTVLARLPDRSSASWREALAPQLRALGCRSLTVDNGMEFAAHPALEKALGGVPVYFTDPGCPWQRGTNEYHNGLLRWWLPKGTDIGQVSAARLAYIMQELNDRPRKQLDWRTPNEVLAELRAPRSAPAGAERQHPTNPTTP